MKTYMILNMIFEGIHRYVDAPEEVKFLRNYHRHLFHVTIKIQLFKGDRELEFFVVQRALRPLIKLWFATHMNYNDTSCETAAKTIHYIVQMQYANRAVSVQVMEDGENGILLQEESDDKNTAATNR